MIPRARNAIGPAPLPAKVPRSRTWNSMGSRARAGPKVEVTVADRAPPRVGAPDSAAWRTDAPARTNLLRHLRPRGCAAAQLGGRTALRDRPARQVSGSCRLDDRRAAGPCTLGMTAAHFFFFFFFLFFFFTFFFFFFFFFYFFLFCFCCLGGVAPRLHSATTRARASLPKGSGRLPPRRPTYHLLLRVRGRRARSVLPRHAQVRPRCSALAEWPGAPAARGGSASTRLEIDGARLSRRDAEACAWRSRAGHARPSVRAGSRQHLTPTRRSSSPAWRPTAQRPRASRAESATRSRAGSHRRGSSAPIETERSRFCDLT
jgi:hypothetical protein